MKHLYKEQTANTTKTSNTNGKTLLSQSISRNLYYKTSRLALLILPNLIYQHAKFYTATEEMGLRFLGEIPYDVKVEEAIGDAERLLNTAIAKTVQHVMVNSRVFQ